MSGSGTQAVDRAAELLSLVVQGDSPHSFTELADETGLAKSTASRLLQALERHRLLERDGDGGFSPGPLFAVYAARHDPTDELVRAATPVLERLGEETRETVNLAVPRGAAVVQVAQVDSTYLLGATNWVGVDVPGHCSALGKVLFAHAALPLPRGPLERRTPRSVASLAALRRELAAIRRAGYATACEELEEGLDAVAAPVYGYHGDVVAAVGISGPSLRIRDRLERLGRLLCEEAATLSALLGHRPRREASRDA